MNLGKPPVVEVSIGFMFESASADPGWDIERASEFVGQFQVDYPEMEMASETHIAEVQKLKRGTDPVLVGKNVPVAVRAFPADRSRYLLNAKDVLQVFFVRTEKHDYPGFTSLREEALTKLAAYVDFFRPAKMIAFTLRYVDFVRIPAANGTAELRDFFTICGEPDEKIFGLTVRFRKSFTTRPPDSQDLLACDLYNIPQPKDQEHPAIAFRMEWALQGFKNVTWERSELQGRLNDAHDRLLCCFRHSFTDTGWKLFEPPDGAA